MADIAIVAAVRSAVGRAGKDTRIVSSQPDGLAQRLVLEAFGRRHRVVSVDLRGHGESEKPQGPYPITKRVTTSFTSVRNEANRVEPM